MFLAAARTVANAEVKLMANVSFQSDSLVRWAGLSKTEPTQFTTPSSLPACSSAARSKPGGASFTVGRSGVTIGRALYRSELIADPFLSIPLLVTGDIVHGFAITENGIGFEYSFSDNCLHHIHHPRSAVGTS